MTDGEAIRALQEKFPKENFRIIFQDSDKKWFLAIELLWDGGGKEVWDGSGKSLVECVEKALKQ